MLTNQQLETWLTMIRTQAWINQQLARDMLREDGVRITWYDVLIHLDHCDDPDYGLRMQDLIDQVIISNSGMTRLVDRLVDEGLVARKIYTDDRREVYVTITEAGRALLQRLMQNHQARIDTYFAQHLNTEELECLLRVFTRIQTAHSQQDS